MGKGKDGRTPSPAQIRGSKRSADSDSATVTTGNDTQAISGKTAVFDDQGSKWEGIYLLPDLDAEAFRADVLACVQAVGPPTDEDAAHFARIVNIMHACSISGHLLLFAVAIEHAEPWGPNSALLTAIGGLVAAVLISTARMMNWVVVGHHVSHGGYGGLAKDQKVDSKFRRGHYATGLWRRCMDWVDWMLPEAWNLEHNKLHHYKLSEDADPDCVERNFAKFRAAKIPQALKWIPMPIFLVGWKYIYYSTNTLKQYKLSQKNSFISRNWPTRPGAQTRTAPLVVQNFIGEILGALVKGRLYEAFFWTVFMLHWVATVLPMMACVVAPAVALTMLGYTDYLGEEASKDAAQLAWRFSVIAELMTNAHTFIIVACNHAGDDLYRFSTSCKGGGTEFLLRCSYAGVNFETGTDFIDIMYGWLNYQIEHHMFPDMTHLQYRKLQPLVKKVCEKHGVLYIQENAFWRTYKTFCIAVGSETMQKATAVLPSDDSRSK